MKLLAGLQWLFRSLYARLALVYLASLIVMSLGTAWIAVGQFDHLGREWLQRSQLNLASNLVRVVQPALRAGPESPAARQAAERIMTINPSLSLYVLDAQGTVVGAYDPHRCGLGQRIDLATVQDLLSAMPMLPVYADAPCHGDQSVFSAAAVSLGSPLGSPRRPGGR